MLKTIILFTFLFFSPALTSAATFSDVSADRSDYRAIGYFYQEEYVGGYEDGTFRPDQAINRVEALKIILNIIDLDVASYDPVAVQDFPDVSESDWFYPFVQQAVQRGIVSGTDAGTLEPGRVVNRVEFLKLLFAAHDIYTSRRGEVLASDVAATAWYVPYLHLAVQTGLLTAADGLLEPGRELTRGEVVALAYQFLQQEQAVLTQANLNEVEDKVLDTLGLVSSGAYDKATDTASQAVAAAQAAKDRLPNQITTQTAYNLAMAVKHLATAKADPMATAESAGKALSYLNLVRDAQGNLAGAAQLIEEALDNL